MSPAQTGPWTGPGCLREGWGSPSRPAARCSRRRQASVQQWRSTVGSRARTGRRRDQRGFQPREHVLHPNQGWAGPRQPLPRRPATGRHSWLEHRSDSVAPRTRGYAASGEAAAYCGPPAEAPVLRGTPACPPVDDWSRPRRSRVAVSGLPGDSCPQCPGPRPGALRLRRQSLEMTGHGCLHGRQTRVKARPAGRIQCSRAEYLARSGHPGRMKGQTRRPLRTQRHPGRHSPDIPGT